MNKIEIDNFNIPRHIAIIMDGNGRWAKEKNLPRLMGHKRGVESVRKITEACSKLKVKHLTLYTFSQENWSRPVDEVSGLMKLFVKSLIFLKLLVVCLDIYIKYYWLRNG